jgi:hypothetical protein
MLLDTSGLLCFHHRAEPQHVEAVQFFQSAPFRMTHSYVLAEFVALAQARRLPRQAALSFVADLHDNTAVQVIYVSEALHRAALAATVKRLVSCSGSSGFRTHPKTEPSARTYRSRGYGCSSADPRISLEHDPT